MSFQKNDQSDFDFSVIDKKPPQQAKLDFSVQSLLSQDQRESQTQQKQSDKNRNDEQRIENQVQEEQIVKVQVEEGSFLKDLQKLQQQLSFQTKLYNVYSQEAQTLNSSCMNPMARSYLHAKSNSHLKTTKQQQSNQPTQSLDDYGYLVLDFRVKKQNVAKFRENQKHCHLLSPSQGSKPINKLKSYTSVGVYTQQIKSQNKKSSRSKFLSPKPNKIKNIQLSPFNQQKFVKASNSKSKQTNKQISKTLNVVNKRLSKQKSPTNKLSFNHTSIKMNASTTIGGTSAKTNKSQAKTMRQGNAYSQYYGFEEIGGSQRLASKSNGIPSSGSERTLVYPAKKGTCMPLENSTSKSKCKKSLDSLSPSNKNLTMKFKKKK